MADLTRAVELAIEQKERLSDLMESNEEYTLKDFFGTPYEASVAFSIITNLAASAENTKN